MITLVQWAKNNGVKPGTAKQWANRGKLVTAQRMGRDWMIGEDEPIPKPKKRKEKGTD